MDIEQIINLVNSKVLNHCNQSLRADQIIVLKGCLSKKTYEKMAREFDIDINYLRGEIVPDLVNLLSEVFDENLGVSSWQVRLELIYLESLAKIE